RLGAVAGERIEARAFTSGHDGREEAGLILRLWGVDCTGFVPNTASVYLRARMSPEDKLRQQLLDLSMNLWWSWNPQTIKLLRDLDPQGFRASKHNALVVARSLTPDRLRELGQDAALRTRVDRAHREFRN